MRQRIALAGALTIGFYLLVAVLAATLIALPFLEWRYLGRLHFQLLLAPIAGIGLLWAAVPRRERFEAPGVELSESDQPELFRVIGEVAEATGEAPPEQVFLVPDVNAFVASAGGFLGFGSRRIMGVGLPLLRILDTDQFRAVIAHEFGHYAGGDTRLGGPLYTVRRAIQRSVDRQHGNAAGAVVAAYERLFLRLTLAVSRDQERAADALAAEVTSPEALSGALRNVAAGARLHDGYVQAALSPMLDAGRRPGWIAGFDAYVAGVGGESAIQAAIDAATQSAESDVYDSHPPLAERLDLIGVAAPPPSALPRATSLLRDGAELEVALLAFGLGEQAVGQLAPMQWSEYPAVMVEMWREERRASADALAGLTVATLPRDHAGWEELARRVLGTDAGRIDHGHWIDIATGVVGRALGVAMIDAGWTVHANPTTRAIVRRGDQSLTPVTTIERLAANPDDVASFQRWATTIGIADLALADQPTPDTAEFAAAASPAVPAPSGGRTELGTWVDAKAKLSRNQEAWYDDEVLALGDLEIPFDAITGFGMKVESVYGQVSHSVIVESAGRTVAFRQSAMGKRRGADGAAAFEELLAVVRSRVERRLVRELLDRLDAGETVTVGPCEIGPDGWRPNAVRRPLTWDEFAGTSVADGRVWLYAQGSTKPKAKGSVPLETVNAPLLPEVLDAASTRFAASLTSVS